MVALCGTRSMLFRERVHGGVHIIHILYTFIYLWMWNEFGEVISRIYIYIYFSVENIEKDWMNECSWASERANNDRLTMTMAYTRNRRTRRQLAVSTHTYTAMACVFVYYISYISNININMPNDCGGLHTCVYACNRPRALLYESHMCIKAAYNIRYICGGS